MGMFDMFSRNRGNLDGPAPAEAGVSPVAGDLGGNDAVKKKQRMLLGGVALVGLLGASFWIFAGDDSASKVDPDKPSQVTVSTRDLLNRNLSEQEWMSQSENRFESTENQLKAANNTGQRVDQLQAQIDLLRGEKQAMSADGQRVVSAYQAENDQLRRQINERAAAPPPPQPGPAALYGPGGQQIYQRPDGRPASGKPMPDAAPPARANEIKLVSFSTAEGGTATKVEASKTVYTDSVNYLPPNSFATARVIVGVDATTGVNSQTDPMPVVLRVTGPARSVYQNGKLLTTKIQGCLINGAARAELSSEKVHVMLQKMTCPQPGGRYAVSQIKGFIAFGGKAGVRGRVVSREGSLVSQAFLAGLIGGFGRGFSVNANQSFMQPNVTVNGKRQQLSLGDIAQGGLGEGVSQTGDMVSKYLIERAEQYQPVIEMPTGVDVEIVFLEGVHVRN